PETPVAVADPPGVRGWSRNLLPEAAQRRRRSPEHAAGLLRRSSRLAAVLRSTRWSWLTPWPHLTLRSSTVRVGMPRACPGEAHAGFYASNSASLPDAPGLPRGGSRWP